jgi:hypothetical protein
MRGCAPHLNVSALFAVVKPFTVCVQKRPLALAPSCKTCRVKTFIFCPRHPCSTNSALGANSLQLRRQPKT